jgi:uncharacterized protein (TIGR04255 family)
MLFPEIERVVYKKKILDKVICQLRFPPILRIDTEIPAEFQGKIIDEYPLYKEKKEYRQINFGPQFAQEPMANVSTTSNIHEFYSQEKEWKISLSRTFISSSNQTYPKWSDFIGHFMKPLEALNEIYKPQYFVRTGLRYINILRRSKLGLEETPWSELIVPSLLGILSSDKSDNAVSYTQLSEISLDEKSKVRITAVLTNDPKSNNEKCLVIDGDFNVNSKLETENIVKQLDELHEYATRFFRWSITEKLHNALEPEKC